MFSLPAQKWAPFKRMMESDREARNESGMSQLTSIATDPFPAPCLNPE
jgi:hypothetical protein